MLEMLREVLYSSYKEDTSAFDQCIKLFPDFALHLTDEYMASLIKSLDNSDF